MTSARCRRIATGSAARRGCYGVADDPGATLLFVTNW
jgi:hypothetical protein